MFNLPLRFPAEAALQDELPPSVLNQRENSIACVKDLGGQLDFITRIDILLQYSSSLYEVLHGDNSNERINEELIICLVNLAFFYREISLDVIQRAYGSEKTDNAWSVGGSYLRKGLGLLHFASHWILSSANINDKQVMCTLVEDMIAEGRVLQQVGIVVLSLSKLRAKMYKDQRDTILDFQEEDLQNLASNSILYAKLVIGCLNTASTCNRGAIINNSLFAYLNCLIFLLLSLDEYTKDETGKSVGMIEQSVNYISKIASKSQLNDPLLSRTRKRDRLKNALQRGPFQNHSNFTGGVPWIRKDKEQSLLPLLQETLEDFLLPLIFLLRYRYHQTNEKVNFKPVENKESDLRKLFPRGKAPEVQFDRWSFDKLTCRLTTKPDSNSNSRYY